MNGKAIAVIPITYIYTYTNSEVDKEKMMM